MDTRDTQHEDLQAVWLKLRAFVELRRNSANDTNFHQRRNASYPGLSAALYARLSTDLQSDKSVEDQLDLCASFARAQGWRVAEQHHDRARTGITIHGRDGLSRLLEGARAGRFDTIVVEALDRLSRDQEDLAGLHKRLTFFGVQIVAVHDGVVDQVQVGIRGLVSALFITDLKHKIRRGMGGVVATAGWRARLTAIAQSPAGQANPRSTRPRSSWFSGFSRNTPLASRRARSRPVLTRMA